MCDIWKINIYISFNISFSLISAIITSKYLIYKRFGIVKWHPGDAAYRRPFVDRKQARARKVMSPRGQ